MKKSSSLLILFILFLYFQQNTNAQSKEYALKAVFFEKFARFTQWPNKFNTDSFKITVIGKNPFAGALKQICTENRMKNKPVSLKFISSPDEIDKPNILFITKSAQSEIPDLLNQIKHIPVLTITEKIRNVKSEAILTFYTTPKGTVHFEINYNKLKISGLKMDPMLLDYAKIVN